MRKALATLGMVVALTLGIAVAPTVVAVATDGSVQVEQAAEAHNYYTCRRDFHVHGNPAWFISYQGWYWKDRDGASRQVYVHKHYWLKPYSEHYRHTWCT